MLGDTYTLEYLPLFDAELSDAVGYIAHKLHNPEAAMKLINDVEQAIQNRLFAPESFESVPTTKNREHKYYRIPVGNYIVLYVVIGNVMEIRRFVYEPSDWVSSI